MLWTTRKLVARIQAETWRIGAHRSEKQEAGDICKQTAEVSAVNAKLVQEAEIGELSLGCVQAICGCVNRNAASSFGLGEDLVVSITVPAEHSCLLG